MIVIDFQDETATGRPYVARIISQLANYEGGVQPEVIGDDEDQTKQKKKVGLLVLCWRQHRVLADLLFWA